MIFVLINICITCFNNCPLLLGNCIIKMEVEVQ